MKNLILEPTDVAQIQALIKEGAEVSHHNLDEETEHHLVAVLLRTLDDESLISHVMAEEFLLAVRKPREPTGLRDVGDRCLVFVGLFPRIAEKRLVQISYFVNIGRTAYAVFGESLTGSEAKFYSKMSRCFVVMMDVLHGVREIGNPEFLTPIENLALWRECGSIHSYNKLCTINALPVNGPSSIN